MLSNVRHAFDIFLDEMSAYAKPKHFIVGTVKNIGSVLQEHLKKHLKTRGYMIILIFGSLRKVYFLPKIYTKCAFFYAFFWHRAFFLTVFLTFCFGAFFLTKMQNYV